MDSIIIIINVGAKAVANAACEGIWEEWSGESCEELRNIGWNYGTSKEK